MSSLIIIKAGKYTFQINEDILFYGENIISRSFRIGGKYDKCISVSYSYKENSPISAKISYVKYEPECSIESNLEKSGGTGLMLKVLINHAFKLVPTIPIFQFDDMSHIDCIEKDMNISPPRPQKKPLHLAYLSIAYNSQTWYEKYFGAKMTDILKYNQYKQKLHFLLNPNDKLDFLSFLQITTPPSQDIPFLENIYKNTNTYRDFFNKIPFDKRCDILFPWLASFMKYYLKNSFSNNDWQIDIRTMNSTQKVGGKSKKNATRKRLFPRKYQIVSFEETHEIA
jgi:hypothetical protein